MDVSFPSYPSVFSKWRGNGSRNGWYMWVHQHGIPIQAAEYLACQQHRPTLSPQCGFPYSKEDQPVTLWQTSYVATFLSWSGQRFALCGVNMYSSYGFAFPSLQCFCQHHHCWTFWISCSPSCYPSLRNPFCRKRRQTLTTMGSMVLLWSSPPKSSWP